MSHAEKSLRDFARSNQKLVWQRQLTFAAGTVLVVFEVDPLFALMGYAACQLTETFEMRLCQRVLTQDRMTPDLVRQFASKILLSGILGAAAIVMYVSLVAMAEGPSIHIGPLFFLQMASLYTAMNTCQLRSVMKARLMVYAVGFVVIPIYDLVILWPNPTLASWTQLGTSLFVLFFVVECARKFASHYQWVKSKMRDLRVERDRLTEALDVQSQFVSIVSHELRTPLTSIKSSFDLIHTDGVCSTVADVRRLTDIGRRNSNRLALLIDDLLDFQKLRAGAMKFKFDTVDLRKLAREAVQITTPLGEPRDVTIDLTLPGLPVNVRGDSHRLLQVMTNILSNAVKFSPDGATVEVLVDYVGTKGRISVRDFGIGIPKNSKDAVFAPFSQIDGSDKRAFGGTGLGMSISRSIIDYHGGLIDYDSVFGVGTVFRIELGLTHDAATALNTASRVIGNAAFKPRIAPKKLAV